MVRHPGDAAADRGTNGKPDEMEITMKAGSRKLNPSKMVAWKIPLAGMALALLAGCSSLGMGGGQAAGEPAPTKSTNSAAGAVLTDQNGMTLYTYDEDMSGSSSCTGLCAAAWPPVYAQDAAQPAGHLTVVARPDGSKQWAKDGMPLYTYDQDKKPGDIKGDGVEGTWHIVRPE
jgi:predicted lipoprotein with Yx(FWY)xxD motif